MVNRSIEENDLIIDRRAHCPQQTSHNKTTWVTVATKDSNLPNSKINQANGIINRTRNTIISTKPEDIKSIPPENTRPKKQKERTNKLPVFSYSTHIMPHQTPYEKTH
jgi:hypothetical protein